MKRIYPWAVTYVQDLGKTTRWLSGDYTGELKFATYEGAKEWADKVSANKRLGYTSVSAPYRRNPKRNPTWLTTALLAGGAYAYGRSETVRASVHSLARAAGAGAKHAAEKAKQAADEYSKKRESAKQNPGLTKAGKRHLIQTMHRAGADTFRKKMRYVRRHMPHITDPAAFVGYVMQGEKR